MNELQHHGVKGMKWGVRRYQKKDGSLTRAGERKKKYLEAVRNEEIRVAKANRQANEKDNTSASKARVKAWLAAETALSSMNINDLRISRKDIIEVGRMASIKKVGFSPRPRW